MNDANKTGRRSGAKRFERKECVRANSPLPPASLE
jgi:hypothetical protein